jgi:DNA-binding transcriptional LysR family regulator
LEHDDVRAMIVFAKVAQLGSFSRAAQALHVSAPAVSQQIRRLEESLQTQLIHRTTRKLTLTHAGQVFVEECAAILQALNQAHAKVAALRDQLTGELRISMPLDPGLQQVIPALSGFIRDNPALTVRLLMGDERIDLIDQRVDVAVRVGHLEDSSLVGRRLTTWQEVICASPQYLAQHGLPRSPEDLDVHEWIVLTLLGEPQVLRLSRVGSADHRVRIRGRVLTNSAQGVTRLALAGLGLARAVEPEVRPLLETGALVRVLPEWSAPPVGAYALTIKRDNQPASVRRCIEHLQAHFESS